MKKNEKIILASNAPEDWPEIQTKPLMQDFGSQAVAFNTMTLIPEFQNVPGKVLKIIGLRKTKLFRSGVLEIPFQIRNKKTGKIFDVYLYPDADNYAAGHFAGVKHFYENLGWPEPIYLCPQQIPAAEPLEVLLPFSFGLFNINEENIPQGEYSIWWPQGKDRLFSRSSAFQSLDRIYNALHGYETYIWAMILKNLEPEDYSESSRIALPDEYTVALSAPEDLVLILDASQEKGVRFFFPKENTSPKYRDNFLELFSGEMAKCREAFEGYQYPKDPVPDEGYPLAWWNLSKEMVEKYELEGKNLESFGSIEI
jgi:hypothetical protein